MKHVFTFALLATLSLTSLASAEVEKGFTSVFNGKDLTGWVGSTKGYEVQDGNLVCPAGRGKGGNLFLKDQYANFIFRFDFKLTPGANNGVGIRTPLEGNPSKVGFEIQILDNTAEKYAKLLATQYCGSIYKTAAAKRGHLKPIGEWNTKEIIADGNIITVKINGVTVVDKYDVSKRRKPAKGYIGFLGHGSDVKFRNIRIKTLPDSKPSKTPVKKPVKPAKKRATVAKKPAGFGLAKLFSDHMVLQRNREVGIWGWAKAGEKVTVSFRGKTVTATADAKTRRWCAKIPSGKAGGPFELSVKCASGTVVLKDVLVGEVWIASGQSNMDFDISRFLGTADGIGAVYTKYVKDSAKANVRTIAFEKATATAPTETLPVSVTGASLGKWQIGSETLTPKFSAVGYVFAVQLSEALGVPVGLIDANKGGSPIEAWMPAAALQAIGRKPTSGTYYNTMFAPMADFPVAGAIWYQGESNARSIESSLAYEKSFKLMIQAWRKHWGVEDMPFLFAQLAAYERSHVQRFTYPVLRDSQAAALALKNVGMATAIDLGNPINIHPPQKLELSRRLALTARKIAYGESKLIACGPVFESLKIDGSKAVVSFTSVGKGLEAKAVKLYNTQMKAGELKGFKVCGADKVFHDATAKIVGDTVVLTSPKVATPVAVRYAWRGFPYANLFNKDGIAAAPFRTDTFKVVIPPAPKPEPKK